MLDFKKWLVTTLVNDATLQTYLKDANGNMNVYPLDVDILEIDPTSQDIHFPAITFQDVSVNVLSVPQGMHVGRVQLDIWSIINADQVEKIYERVGRILNFKDSTTQTIPNNGILWWIREEAETDRHNARRRIWRKQVDLKFWANNSSNT